MVGIIEEQHPERTRLFMQWKQMNWPLMVDSLNLLETLAVPVTVLIDEQGIVRAVQPGQEEFEKFLKTDYAASGMAAAPIPESASKGNPGEVESLRREAQQQFLWSGESALDSVIEKFEAALALEPEDGPTHFRLGVAYRRRYDSRMRRPGDFEAAVRHWTRALQIDPNQYIWRRRIQQYGPRLDKPYSFYDWVHQARQEIRERGEVPLPLSVEPGGAEFAQPVKDFETTRESGEEPDPGGRILRDEEGLILVETAIVPDTSTDDSYRVHVVMRPNLQKKAHWNNEVDDLVFWVDPPRGWQIDSRYQTVKIPPEPLSQEVRQVEFELKRTDSKAMREPRFSGYALYYVCEDVNGTCLYRRQDVGLEVDLRK